MLRRHRWTGVVLCTLFLWNCSPGNETPLGLVETTPTGGPVVEFDLDERPFPNIPFPNDLATRLDPTSPTGKRINVSELGATQAEVKVRRAINRTSGFGVFSPITVSFTEPLDVERIIARHHEDVPDFSNDAVYLVNVDPDSPTYREFELLDMGRGNFPVTLARPDGYYMLDPRSDGTNLLFETVREVDEDENGILDPLEDTDDDGVWDEPNTRHPDDDVKDFGRVLDFYERETNTLIIRPVHVLEPGTRYAVVLTRALTGLDDRPVQSPFDSINHTNQTRDLEPLREILPDRFPERFDSDLSEVQFAWSFTTQVPTQELEAIRAGLYGHGPLDWLAERFPARLNMIHNVKSAGSEKPMTFDLGTLLPLIIPIAAAEAGPEGARVIEESFKEIDYLVSGTFLSPYFLVDKGPHGARGGAAAWPGTNPVDDDESFAIDLASGQAEVSDGEVPFVCAVPKVKAGREAPFPTIIYSHAISSTRLEILIFAGAMAKFGMATCTIDAAGHGLHIPNAYKRLVDQVAQGRNMPNLSGVLNHHRARDVTNDGIPNPGGDYFTSDMLHSRDMMRQTTIDQMQLVRILRTFDGTLRFPDSIDEDDPFIQAQRELAAEWDQTGNGEPELAGDFNGDGIVDLGGDGPYVAWGTSLGGLQTSILAAVEPTIIAGASNAGGGGLTDIAIRSTISNVRAGVILRMMGPVLIGRPYVSSDQIPTGRTRLEWILPNADHAVHVHFADVSGLEDGDKIVLRNLAKEANPIVPEEDSQSYALVRNGRFRVGIAADAKSAMTRRAILGFDPSIDVVEDLMGCVEASSCGEVACPEGRYCGADGTCRRLSTCTQDFDAHATLDEEGLDLELRRRTAWQPRALGDGLVIEIYNADGEHKETLDTFPQNTVYQNILYPEGAPLAALIEGWGLTRQTPRFRQFIGVAQAIAESADPAVYAPHFFKRPLKFPYESERYQVGATNFFQVGTLGDQTVPISSGIAVARTAGIVDTHRRDGRYGKTQNNFLIDNYVYEGIPRLSRFPDYPNNLFDPDHLDEGRYRNPSDPLNPSPKPVAARPLRAVKAMDQ
ncbi:MAG: hypothetical protein ACNA8W_09555, partial [Bradymonadaceae bacterium]